MKRALAILSALLFTAALALPAGTVIRNQVQGSYIADGEAILTFSNTVETVVRALCALSILPDGSYEAPAHTLPLYPGMSRYLPYRLTNSGNAPHYFELEALFDGGNLSLSLLEVIHDLDGSGTFDPGEPRVQGLELAIDETVSLLLHVRTEAAALNVGDESFVNLRGECFGGGASDMNNLARLYVPERPLVTGLVWQDNNANGLQDPGEPPLSGVEVRLYRFSGGQLVASTRSDASGRYFFHALRPDLYTLEFLPPAGYRFSPALVGDDPTRDSDADPLTGRTLPFDLLPEGVVEHMDAGLYRLADLSIVKSNGVSEVLPGQTLRYEIEVRNAGPADVEGAVVEDTLPEGLENATWRCFAETGAVCTAQGTGNLSDRVNLRAGSSLRYELIATVRLTAEGEIVNTARVTPPLGVIDPLPENNEATDRDLIISDFGDFRKDALPLPGSALLATETIVYTLTFTAPNRPLRDLHLSDALDALLAAPTELELFLNGSLQADAVRYEAATHRVVASLPLVPAGAEVQVRIYTRLLETAPGGASVVNRAQLRFSGGSLDSNTVQHEVSRICRPHLTPDGTVAAPGQTLAAAPGDTLVLPYTLRNDGNSTGSYRLELRRLEPSAFAAESMQLILDLNGNGSPDEGEPEVTVLEDLPLGAERQLLLVVRLPNDPSIAGNLFVTPMAVCIGNETQRDEDNVALITVAAGGFEGVGKEAVPAAGVGLAPNSEVRYSIRFRTRGQALQNVTVEDVLSPYLSDAASSLRFTDGSITDPESGQTVAVSARYDATTRTLSWFFPSLPAGIDVALQVSTTVSSSAPNEGTIENRACVSHPLLETLCSAMVSHPIAPLALEIDKTAEPETITPGLPLHYNIRVKNLAPYRLEHSELRDVLPAGMSYVPGTATIRLPDGRTEALELLSPPGLRWRLPPLENGEEVTVRFEVTVSASVLHEREIINIAEVTVYNGNGQVITSRADSAVNVVNPRLLGLRSVLMGTAYYDNDQDGRFSAGDQPVAGVRLYLPNGVSTVTDALGRYTFLDLPEGMITLKADPLTFPARSLLTVPHEAAPGLYSLRLYPGLISRQDIPFRAATVRLDMAAANRSSRGPVTVAKTLEPDGDSVRVVLQVQVTEALRGLTLEETFVPLTLLRTDGQLPPGAEVTETGLRFPLGDVAAGFEIRLTYSLSGGTPLLSAPAIFWELR